MKYFTYYPINVSGKEFYSFLCGNDNKIGVGVFYVESKDLESNLKALEKMGYENRNTKNI